MDPLVQRLKQRAADLDASSVDPQRSLPTVLRRGRRYLLLTQLVAVTVAGSAVAAGAVVLPGLLEPTPTPAVVSEREDDRPTVAPSPRPEVQKPAVVDTDTAEPKPAEEPPKAEKSPEAAQEASGSSTETEADPAPKQPEPQPKPTATEPKPTATESAPTEPKPEPTSDESSTEEPDAAELYLTANQKHDVVEGEPPTNLYWGTATPGQDVKVYSDHGWASTTAAADGTWQLELVFHNAPGGEATFEVIAKLWAHPEHHQSFSLTTVRGEVVAFSATQHTDTVPASDPRGRWSGTAQPNTTVWIYSEYGQTEVVADADGNWSAELLFEDPPVGEPFDVKAKSSATGEAIWFTVTVVE